MSTWVSGRGFCPRQQGLLGHWDGVTHLISGCASLIQGPWGTKLMRVSMKVLLDSCSGKWSTPVSRGHT